MSEIPIGVPYRLDRDGTNACFGCGPHNPDGLQLVFVRIDERTVECRKKVPAHLRGPDGVVHGGIQATLLDETSGAAAQLGVADTDETVVTAELALRYRRPVPIDGEIVVRAELERVEDRDLYVRGAIVGADGTELCVATSRWRRLPLG